MSQTHFISQLKCQFATAETSPLGLQTICNALPPWSAANM